MHTAANQKIQQMYVNEHFCYAYKLGIVTNRSGIVRDTVFYSKEFQTCSAITYFYIVCS